MINAYFESRNKAILSFRSTETILIDGRLVTATLRNSGPTPARDVVVAIASAPATIEFDAGHVHAQPPVPFETVIRKGQLEVKLKSPLGEGQTVSITVDDIHVKNNDDPMFLVSATSDLGFADRQGHEVVRRPNSTLNQYLGIAK